MRVLKYNLDESSPLLPKQEQLGRSLAPGMGSGVWMV
jgi:hypothetical protein